MSAAVPQGADVLAHAEARAEHARDRLRALRSEVEELTRVRDQAIRELSAGGLSYDAIAAASGVSRARVGQVVTSAAGGSGPQR